MPLPEDGLPAAGGWLPGEPGELGELDEEGELGCPGIDDELDGLGIDDELGVPDGDGELDGLGMLGEPEGGGELFDLQPPRAASRQTLNPAARVRFNADMTTSRWSAATALA